MGSTFSASICCKRGVSEPEFRHKDYYKHFYKEKTKITKIQSTWKAFRKRKEIKKTRSTITPNGNYTNSDQPNPHVNWKVLQILNSLPPFKSDEYVNTNGLKRVGPILMDNNIIYKGYINQNMQKEGYGELFLPDGSKFEGYFKAGKMEGKGRLVNIQGDYYEGDFEFDKANGTGKYVSCDGVVYIGMWKDDKQHGKGKEIYPDKSKYTGDFEFGEKNGKGRFSWSDGSYYEGELVRNSIEGRGVYRWKDGRIYYGDWKSNKMDGIGIFIWPDKKKFVGMYKDDKKEGYGVFYWADGRRYEGMWMKGKQNGYGMMILNNIKKFGEWKDGKKLNWIEQNTDEIENIISKMRQNVEFDELLEKFKEIQL